MEESSASGGYASIYKDLLKRLEGADMLTLAQHLDLPVTHTKEVEIPFFGNIYLLSKKGVRRSDGKRFSDAAGSALIYYILSGSRCRPAGQFVTFAELAGPLFKHGSYST